MPENWETDYDKDDYQDYEKSSGEQAPASEGQNVRLNKLLAQAGVASRRAIENLIHQGRIEVNGHTIRQQGTRVDPATAVIKVDGERVIVRDDMMYLALNKPFGWQSTMSDDQGRPCVGDIIQKKSKPGVRLFHVGRLDANTEGLLLLTNDGDLAHKLMHPSFHVPKTYLVQVQGVFTKKARNTLLTGIELDDGPAAVDSLKIVGQTDTQSQMIVTIHEGRKHIIRRMFAAVNFPVTGLVRTHIADVALGSQRPGSIRVLNTREISSLHKAVETD